MLEDTRVAMSHDKEYPMSESTEVGMAGFFLNGRWV
jgi:hypothetical protein